jgi:enoyl-CoA hydratase/carnithine racemase
MTKFVTLDRPAAGVAVITMTNPAINNHGSWEGMMELWHAMTEARTGGARVTVLASGVEGAWLHHAWLRDLSNMFQGKEVTAPNDGWFGCADEITKFDVVTIAAISGDTSGGGCELGWACDLRVAEAGVLFSQPEVRIGIGVGMGGASRLVRLIGRTITAEMILDGVPMTAERIYQLGGVNKLVAKGQATKIAVEWAKRLASHPPAALAAMKRMLNASQEMTLSESVMNDQRVFQEISGRPAAIAKMEEAQAKFDAGLTMREAFWSDEPDE